MKRIPLIIDGKGVESKAEEWIDNVNPATQECLARVPLCGTGEIDLAVQSAERAFAAWKETPVMERVRVLLRLQALLKENQEKIARLITAEQGKTLPDARGDLMRGIEVVEFAISIPSLMMGETVENVAAGIDTYSFQQPLGVCAGITPFNFPAMIPLWMFPIAIALGNTFVLKPSEYDPMTPQYIAELAQLAGLPPGVLNVVHGGREAVNALCDHPAIQAISFVGSAPVGRLVHERASKSNKRVQALLGAKNHVVITPDANKEKTLNAIVGAAFGASGQRCMAVSVAVFVGDAEAWVPDLIAKAKQLKVGPGDQDSDVGPVITRQAKERIEQLIASGVEEGAKLLLDGRGYAVPGYEKGNFIGPTLFDEVTTEMAIYREEIFGPVLLVFCVPSLEEAIRLVNNNPYGNGTAIFTESGKAARHFQHHIDVGQVGINIPIPVPLPFFSFTGWKGSLHGDMNAYGKHAVRFYSRTKTVTARWFGDDGAMCQKINTTIGLST